MIVGVPKEVCPGERLVALTPSHVRPLQAHGFEVLVERGAGLPAGFPDDLYAAHGAQVIPSRSELLRGARVILQVRTSGSHFANGAEDVNQLGPDHVVIGLTDALRTLSTVQDYASRGVTVFALDLIPRIARAQSMDVLSSLATIAGYKSVLLAAVTLPKLFPMLTTAAATLAPARVLVIGAGVAGLQAIATARRLGAAVSGYDVRPAVKEHVLSLGAKFIDVPVDAARPEDEQGYATALSDRASEQQRAHLAPAVSSSEVVITTAIVPGRPAPQLITAAMVSRMVAGSVLVDLAADHGGNCELTRPDATVVHQGVTILGPTNLPSTVAHQASQLYGRHLVNFLTHVFEKGSTAWRSEDPIVQGTLLTHGGLVVHPRVTAQFATQPTPSRG